MSIQKTSIISFIASSTRGDVQPAITLGKALQTAGLRWGDLRLLELR